jgi:hypothetical protein
MCVPSSLPIAWPLLTLDLNLVAPFNIVSVFVSSGWFENSSKSNCGNVALRVIVGLPKVM